jgi:hypothetical protein
MPAEFTFYFKDLPQNYNGAPPYIVVYESPNKEYLIVKKTLNIYDSESLTTIIGICSVTYTNFIIIDKNLKQYNSTSVNTSIIFNENASFPNGNDNVLVFEATYIDSIDLSPSNFGLLDGYYKSVVNTSLSTGKYANQAGYRETYKDSTQDFVINKVYFPQPILTYTNAFNSLPQPNTAPLPA